MIRILLKKFAFAFYYIINLEEREIVTSLETKYFFSFSSLTQQRTARNVPIVWPTKSKKIQMERHEIQCNKQNILAELLSLH